MNTWRRRSRCRMGWHLAVVACFVPAIACAQDPTWIEVEGVLYGAKADDQGPIGGGEGYSRIATSGTHTATTLEALVEALAKAQAGETVFLPGDAEIDMTTLIYIDKLVLDVPAGVTLASNRGEGGSPGALLTSDALDTPVMIKPLGPGVRVTGLRVRGPNAKRYIDHHTRAFGPGGGGHPYYYKFPVSNGIVTKDEGLEVDNCEISAFGHAGIVINSGTTHRVHHCYIHHCQYQGLGYGISFNTASAVIEYNLFDSNRHSIAGTGRPGCGYVARHNVELGTSLSHCFDMHGGRDREDGTDIAGTHIEIHNNTFRAPQTPVAIRGVPEDVCTVHHNWFPKHEPGKAVRGGDRTEAINNAYGTDPVHIE